MRLNRFFAGILVALVCSLPSNAVIIKLGSLAPSGSPWDNALRQMSSEWASASGGKVQLKIYPGGIAGDEMDMIRKMRIGQLNAAGVTGVGLSKIYNGIMAMQLPLFVRTDAELSYIMEKASPAFEAELQSKGYIVLAWSRVGWVHFFAKTPVTTIDDMKNQRLFIWAGDADGQQLWKENGFQIVPLNVSDMMTSLQSGMVDAFSTTPLSAASYQWFGLAGNMSDMKWAPLIGAIIISTASWNAIPEDLRPKLLAQSRAAGASMQIEIDKADNDAISIMKQHGLKVHAASKEAVDGWKSLADNSLPKLAGKSYDSKSYDMVKKYLDEFRSNQKNRQ